MSTALRQELAPFDVRVALVEPGSIRSEAVGKLDADARQIMSEASPAERALYQEAFFQLVSFFSALHHRGSAPDAVARVVEHALTTARPRARYLAGKNARRMALVAALLPAAAQDLLRRRLAHQPAPASLRGAAESTDRTCGST
jgi:NAD(P)-dependent dehydrogenase (short-subunit alcohol dehydrogenase family)